MQDMLRDFSDYFFPVPPAQLKRVLRVVVGDFHSGSSYALFINREWHGRKTSHIPRAKQVEIRKRFEIFKEELNKVRQACRVELVVDGDAIDGDHHHSGDVCSTNELEQADIHIEIMRELQMALDWRAGDTLHYTRGTETHVHEMEEYIGKELNAVQADDGAYVFDLLKLETYGTLSWFVHHGLALGRGKNEGNVLRNGLGAVYADAKRDNIRPPDILYSAHVHTPGYDSYNYRENGLEYKTMHGIISPAWQVKTTYGWKVAALRPSYIGGVYHFIDADGRIETPPRFSFTRFD